MPQLRDHRTVDSRIYGRRRGEGAPRYYGDFRDYSDVGGGQEPLVPEGKSYATTCPDEAAELSEERLEELKNKRKKRPTGPASKRALKVLIPDHLVRKAKLDEGGEQWLGNL